MLNQIATIIRFEVHDFDEAKHIHFNNFPFFLIRPSDVIIADKHTYYTKRIFRLDLFSRQVSNE